MSKDLRTFLLAVGIPALAIACAGIALIRYEIKHEAARQELHEQELQQLQEQYDQELDAREQEWQTWQQQLEERMKRREGMRQKREGATEGAGSQHRGGRGGADGAGGPPPRRKGRPPSRKNGGPPHWNNGGYSPGEVRQMLSPEVFSPEPSVATERILWIGGCMLGLLFLSFGAGGWLLVRSARAAREEALKKTDFLSNISHEFKTPLTTICLCAELAQDEGLSPERRRKALGSIVSEANRLKGLVLNALDFSRLEKHRRAFALVSCDLVQLIAEAARPMMERFPEGGLSLPRGEVPARADVTAFKQILVILLDNAAKYAASNGPVEVFCATESSHAVVRVADRGPGLDKEGLRHAFDRFWRGDNATTAETGGSGLGLAIAKGLAKGMKGDLTVELRAGGGLTFTLTLDRPKACPQPPTVNA